MRLLSRLLCMHEDVVRSDGKRMFVSCLKCGRDSKGILTGGFSYNRARQFSGRMADVAKAFKPRRLKRG